eukprot:4902441-Ditylum_brightwellii.AAC.1
MGDNNNNTLPFPTNTNLCCLVGNDLNNTAGVSRSKCNASSAGNITIHDNQYFGDGASFNGP